MERTTDRSLGSNVSRGIFESAPSHRWCWKRYERFNWLRRFVSPKIYFMDLFASTIIRGMFLFLTVSPRVTHTQVTKHSPITCRRLERKQFCDFFFFCNRLAMGKRSFPCSYSLLTILSSARRTIPSATNGSELSGGGDDGRRQTARRIWHDKRTNEQRQNNYASKWIIYQKRNCWSQSCLNYEMRLFQDVNEPESGRKCKLEERKIWNGMCEEVARISIFSFSLNTSSQLVESYIFRDCDYVCFERAHYVRVSECRRRAIHSSIDTSE